MSMIESSPKTSAEVTTLQFDFLSQMATSETLISASCTCVVWSGVDATPSAVLSGSTTVSTPVAKQKITGGVEGTIYLITCNGLTSLSNRPVIQTYVPVVSYPI